MYKLRIVFPREIHLVSKMSAKELLHFSSFWMFKGRKVYKWINLVLLIMNQG